MREFRRVRGRGVFVGLALTCCLAAHALASGVAFNIAAGAAGNTLKQFAAQAHVQLLFDYQAVSALKTPAVKGQLEPTEALKQLLEGSEFTFREVNDHTIAIVSLAASASQAPAPSGVAPHDGDEHSKEAGKNSSQEFRVAQVDQTGTGPQVADKKVESRRGVIEEVVVTGSRIPRAAAEGAQEVKIYSRQKIEESGRTTISDFLNTLPDVSIAIGENGLQTLDGAATVQLHGLPLGTTLVLINGRRLETSGVLEGTGNAAFFDLNNIPLAAVDRIEVVSEGSSAIYGSDAIAGVVNIVLRKDYDGFEANAKYGAASGTDEWGTDLAWGKQWSRGSLFVVGSFQSRSELLGLERSITTNGDGNSNFFLHNSCTPGNVFSTDGSNLPGVGSASAGVPPGFTGKPTQSEFAPMGGILNRCGIFSEASFIPATHRDGILIQGEYKLWSSTELFMEVMYSHVHQDHELFSPGLSGTVPASNPFNPFGEAVNVAGNLVGLGREAELTNTNFVRPLIGARGNFLDSWQWEFAGWGSRDTADTNLTNQPNSTAIQAALSSTDPATALNPFIDGPSGSPQLLHSLVLNQPQQFYGEAIAANGFLRGPVLSLPSGPVEVVLGAEYDFNKLFRNHTEVLGTPLVESTFGRHSRAVFSEARVPIVANHSDLHAGDTLAVTLAGRYDDYSDFGGKTTPQYGAEWRPSNALLIRGTYGRAFRAPNLFQLYSPQVTLPVTVVDPLTGQAVATNFVAGGNQRLRPETGESRTFGLVYASKSLPDLQLSVTYWKVRESSSIQSGVSPQAIVNNENLFPGFVTRGPAGPDGTPGPILLINDTTLNFGDIDVAGLDYEFRYKYDSSFGQLSTSLSATQTYTYSAAFQPNTPAIDRTSIANDDGNWAPRWKGIATLGWALGPYSFNANGRYIGRYQDYDSAREIGNFWLFDANLRLAIGQAAAPENPWLKRAYVVVGGINLLDRKPQYSGYLFNLIGYDPAQADIRGRFLYAQFGIAW